jgi:hypothetical protein
VTVAPVVDGVTTTLVITGAVVSVDVLLIWNDADATVLFCKPDLTATARTVPLFENVNGAVYTFDETVGVVPSVV